jgi:hypothetical protein
VTPWDAPPDKERAEGARSGLRISLAVLSPSLELQLAEPTREQITNRGRDAHNNGSRRF